MHSLRNRQLAGLGQNSWLQAGYRNCHRTNHLMLFTADSELATVMCGSTCMRDTITLSWMTHSESVF